jgi:protein-L-isoaspartate(D-aspartate) O-methyltransferase
VPAPATTPPLLAAITAAPVVTMDTNQQVVAEAGEALGRLGLDGQVTVVHGDGYDGWPAAAPYDRIIVTCGCFGLSPRWLGQLAPGGLALVPIAHGGVHPIVTAWREGPTVRGRMVLWADFMEAAGPLGQQQPAVLHTLPADAEFTSYRRVGPVLDWEGYAALWCSLTARDRRITRAATLVEGIDPMNGMCALHDPDRGTAWIQMDGSVHVAGEPELLEETARLLREWETLGQPPIQSWRCTFAETVPAAARSSPQETGRSWARPLSPSLTRTDPHDGAGTDHVIRSRRLNAGNVVQSSSHLRRRRSDDLAYGLSAMVGRLRCEQCAAPCGSAHGARAI